MKRTFNPLFDGDSAKKDAGRARSRVTVGAVIRQSEVEAAWQERRDAKELDTLVGRWHAAGGDLAAEIRVAADAERYDRANGSQLRDRLFAAVAGDEPGLVAA